MPLLPQEHMRRHESALGFRAAFLSDSAVAFTSATSLRVARRFRWRLLGMALQVRVLTMPHSPCRLAWRVNVLHERMIADVRVATTTCIAALRELPRQFASMVLPQGDTELPEARRTSLVTESRDARARWNRATLLLQRVTQTRGHGMWVRLRGQTCLFYFHVMRRLELRLTVLDAPRMVLEAVRNCAVMLAQAGQTILGDAATRGIEMREFQVDPFGLTPRLMSRRAIPRMSLVAGRLLQEQAEEAFELFIQGLKLL